MPHELYLSNYQKITINDAPVTKSDATKVIGSTGLRNLGGRLQEDEDTKLRIWSEAVKFYREMMHDLTISTGFRAVNLPLLSAEFDVIPASDSPVDKKAAQFLWDAINSMHQQTWRSHVHDALESVAYGWSLGEIVLDRRSDGLMWLREIAPRGQETLERWEFDTFDDVTAFVQRDPDTGRLATIPIEKLIHHTFNGRKGNPQGEGLLRIMFRTYRFIRQLENLEAIGLERSVGGIPMAKLPPEPLSDADIEALQEALRNLRLDDEAYLITPDGLDITPYAGNIDTTRLAATIDRKQKELLTLLFAQFIKLGMGEVGTQALVKGQSDFFTLGLESVQQQMLEVWNSQLVPYLFQFNLPAFRGLENLPIITWSKPGKVDVQALMQTYERGTLARVITPLQQDEEHFRGILDLPDMPIAKGEDKPVTEGGVALTGIQISSLQGIIQSVSSKQMSPEAAILLIRSSFPQLPADVVDEMVKAAGEFVPAIPSGDDEMPIDGVTGVPVSMSHQVEQRVPERVSQEGIDKVNSFKRNYIKVGEEWHRKDSSLYMKLKRLMGWK